MNWWEEKKHVLVREKYRIDTEFPENKFSFVLKNNDLWLTGTILDFFEFELKYPKSYPFHHPTIYPKDRLTEWVKKHQYTSGGFCLDIREKTWNHSLSAADIIKSLEVLLIAEGIRKIKEEEKLIVYEEEEPTRLQKKIEQHRCIIPSDITFLNNTTKGFFKYIFFIRDSEFRIIVSAIKGCNDDEYKESSLVKKIWNNESIKFTFKNGIWLRASLEEIIKLLRSKNFIDVNTTLTTKYSFAEDKNYQKLIVEENEIILLMQSNDYPKAFFYLEVDLKKDTCTPYGTYLLDSASLFERLPSKGEYNTIKSKKVSIIGCGSGGSKIAEYLIKAGIENVNLIDGDYLTTENIIRHICQLDDIDIEKVHAVKNKLIKINPSANIKTLFKHLDTIDPRTDELLKESDLIVVATALNEEIFNEYAYNHGIPAIYAKVYPLGFGGEVIRTIPRITPCYECINLQKELFLKNQFNDALFPDFNTTSYDILEDGQQISIPSLAIDADFIVLIASKMAIELLSREKSQRTDLTSNVRLWGNKKEWIFDQEYQCLTINNGNLRSIENCIVCFGNYVIEKELSFDLNKIENEYTDLINKIGKENIDEQTKS